MGAVRDRGKQIATYLRGFTGSPLISYAYNDPNGYSMPPGLRLHLTLNRNPRVAVNMAKALKDSPDIAGVAYAFDARDMDDVVVMLPLRSYTTLLKGHLDRP